MEILKIYVIWFLRMQCHVTRFVVLTTSNEFIIDISIRRWRNQKWHDFFPLRSKLNDLPLNQCIIFTFYSDSVIVEA